MYQVFTAVLVIGFVLREGKTQRWDFRAREIPNSRPGGDLDNIHSNSVNNPYSFNRGHRDVLLAPMRLPPKKLTKPDPKQPKEHSTSSSPKSSGQNPREKQDAKQFRANGVPSNSQINNLLQNTYTTLNGHPPPQSYTTYNPPYGTYNQNPNTYSTSYSTYSQGPKTYAPNYNTYSQAPRTYASNYNTYNQNPKTYTPNHNTYNQYPRTYTPNHNSYRPNPSPHVASYRTHSQNPAPYTPNRGTYNHGAGQYPAAPAPRSYSHSPASPKIYTGTTRYRGYAPKGYTAPGSYYYPQARQVGNIPSSYSGEYSVPYNSYSYSSSPSSYSPSYTVDDYVDDTSMTYEPYDTPSGKSSDSSSELPLQVGWGKDGSAKGYTPVTKEEGFFQGMGSVVDIGDSLGDNGNYISKALDDMPRSEEMSIDSSNIKGDTGSFLGKSWDDQKWNYDDLFSRKSRMAFGAKIGHDTKAPDFSMNDKNQESKKDVTQSTKSTMISSGFPPIFPPYAKVDPILDVYMPLQKGHMESSKSSKSFWDFDDESFLGLNSQNSNYFDNQYSKDFWVPQTFKYYSYDKDSTKPSKEKTAKIKKWKSNLRQHVWDIDPKKFILLKDAPKQGYWGKSKHKFVNNKPISNRINTIPQNKKANPAEKYVDYNFNVKRNKQNWISQPQSSWDSKQKSHNQISSQHEYKPQQSKSSGTYSNGGSKFTNKNQNSVQPKASSKYKKGESDYKYKNANQKTGIRSYTNYMRDPKDDKYKNFGTNRQKKLVNKKTIKPSYSVEKLEWDGDTDLNDVNFGYNKKGMTSNFNYNLHGKWKGITEYPHLSKTSFNNNLRLSNMDRNQNTWRYFQRQPKFGTAKFTKNNIFYETSKGQNLNWIPHDGGNIDSSFRSGYGNDNFKSISKKNVTPIKKYFDFNDNSLNVDSIFRQNHMKKKMQKPVDNSNIRYRRDKWNEKSFTSNSFSPRIQGEKSFSLKSTPRNLYKQEQFSTEDSKRREHNLPPQDKMYPPKSYDRRKKHHSHKDVDSSPYAELNKPYKSWHFEDPPMPDSYTYKGKGEKSAHPSLPRFDFEKILKKEIQEHMFVPGYGTAKRHNTESKQGSQGQRNTARQNYIRFPSLEKPFDLNSGEEIEAQENKIASTDYNGGYSRIDLDQQKNDDFGHHPINAGGRYSTNDPQGVRNRQHDMNYGNFKNIPSMNQNQLSPNQGPQFDPYSYQHDTVFKNIKGLTDGSYRLPKYQDSSNYGQPLPAHQPQQNLQHQNQHLQPRQEETYGHGTHISNNYNTNEVPVGNRNYRDQLGYGDFKSIPSVHTNQQQADYGPENYPNKGHYSQAINTIPNHGGGINTEVNNMRQDRFKSLHPTKSFTFAKSPNQSPQHQYHQYNQNMAPSHEAEINNYNTNGYGSPMTRPMVSQGHRRSKRHTYHYNGHVTHGDYDRIWPYNHHRRGYHIANGDKISESDLLSSKIGHDVLTDLKSLVSEEGGYDFK